MILPDPKSSARGFQLGLTHATNAVMVAWQNDREVSSKFNGFYLERWAVASNSGGSMYQPTLLGSPWRLPGVSVSSARWSGQKTSSRRQGGQPPALRVLHCAVETGKWLRWMAQGVLAAARGWLVAKRSRAKGSGQGLLGSETENGRQSVQDAWRTRPLLTGCALESGCDPVLQTHSLSLT